MTKTIKRLTVTNNTADFVKAVVPTIINNDDVFEGALNATLWQRYNDKYSLRLTKSQNTLKAAEETLHQYEEDTDEYNKALEKKEQTLAKITAYTAVLESLENIKNDIPNDNISEDIKTIVNFYATYYESVIGIGYNNQGSPIEVKAVIPQIHALYTRCREYADKYESTAEDWTDTRKEDFKAIKNTLLEAGSRLNGERTDNRNGYKYSATSKIVFRAIACVTKQDALNNEGKGKEKIVSYENFQRSILAGFFKINEEKITSSNVMYI